MADLAGKVAWVTGAGSGIGEAAALALAREGAAVALGKYAQVVERVAEDGQQAVDPVIDLRPAEAKDFGQERLQGVGLEVGQQEQPLLFRRWKPPVRPPPADR